MKNKVMYCGRLVCLLVFCLLVGQVWAGRLQYSKYLKGPAIVAGAGLTVSDDFWPEIATGASADLFRDKLVRNYIKLHYTGQENKQYLCTGSFSVSVRYSYTGFDKDRDLHSGKGTVTVNVDYDANKSVELDLAEITGNDPLHFVQVNITVVASSGISSVPADLVFETGIEVERYFILDETSPTVPEITAIYSTKNQLNLYWQFIRGAEEYDLEWAYVDKQTEDYATLDIDDLDPTSFNRVTLPQNTFTLNMVYDLGKVFFRVRGVGKFGDRFEDVLEGVWSSDADDEYEVLKNFVLTGVSSVASGGEDFLVKNWTYQQSFAEGGKQKEVVSFFDGSGRNRQSVTLSNSYNVSVIGETYYDFEGRPVIATLPTPAGGYSGVMRYFQGLAINNDGGRILIQPEYDVSDDGGCEPVGLELASTKGSSRYYSPSNTIKAAFQQYLPNAFLYPYSRTAFDSEGRVKSQAGPGKTFALGQDHTVDYFYATPSQEALNRMLGSQAGYASHYILEAVEDANGQIAMTYKDMSGKVVATSLTGAAPTQLEALESNTGATDFTQSLMSTYESVPEPAYITNQTIFLPAAGDYEFVYTVNMENYSGLCNSEGGNCTYDMVMSIYNSCNLPVTETDGLHEGATEEILYTTAPFTFTYDPMDVTESFSFTVTITKPGTYVVSKKLTLNAAAFATAVDDYRTYLETNLPEACIEGINLPEPPCGVSCADYCQQLAEDGIEGNECPAGYCDSYYDTTGQDCAGMLDIINADMLPGGQYFDGMPAGTSAVTYDWLEDNISEVYDNEHTAHSCAPVSCGTGGSITDPFWCLFNFYNPGFGGEINSWNEVNTYLLGDPGTDAGEVIIPVFGTCSTTTTQPLITFHPEYCQYVRCTTLNTPISTVGNKSSMQFDKEILLTTSFDDAVAKGWLEVSSAPCTTVVCTTLVEQDPLYTQAIGTDDLEAYATGTGYTYPVSSGADMWAEAKAICGTGCDCDEVWQVLKGVYSAMKQSFINDWLEDGCVALCDLNVPPDQIADNCGGSTLAVGYHINFPVPSGELYDDATSSTTDPEMDDVVDAAGDFNIACINYIDIDFCTLVERICNDECVSPTVDNLDDPQVILCSGIDCDYFTTVHHGWGVYIGGEEIIPSVTNAALAPLMSFLDHGLDCDPTASLDYASFYADLIDAIQASGSSWNAMQLDDCTIRIFNNSSTDHSGELVQLGYGQTDGGDYWIAGNGCIANLGVIDYQCTPTEVQDCACHWLQLDYNALLEANPGSTAEEIYAMMAAEYSDDANFPGLTVIADSVESWMSLCAEFGVPCTSPDGNSCMPAGLLADCNVQPEDCEEEQAAVANYYENLDVQEKIDSLVNLFRQHYIDECFGGNFGETFTYEGASHEYHYTLYHYDQAGNLTSTVPPKGVQLVSSTLFAQIDANRDNPADEDYAFVDPQHQQKSMYRYNSYGLVTEENVPDKQDILEGEIDPNSNTGNYLQVQMINGTDGFAIKEVSGVYSIVTTNTGGTSWSGSVSLPGGVTTVYAMHFFTQDNALIFTEDGAFKRTSGGWSSAITATVYNGYALDGLNKLYAYTSTGIIDAFILTNPLTSAFNAPVSSVVGAFTTDLNSIVYNGINDYLVLANDNGVNNLHIIYDLSGTPSVESKTISGITIYALEMVEPEVILMGGESGGDESVYWTTLIPGVIPDIGSSVAANISASGARVKSFASAGGMIYAVGTLDLFRVSSDYGLNWDVPYTTGSAPSGVDYYDVAIAPGGTKVVLGGNGNTPAMNDSKATDQRYYYDQLGRIKASQNTKQYNKAQRAYSYSVYDAEGRVIEAGEAQGVGVTDLDAPSMADMNDYANWPGNWLSGGETRKEVTRATYDESIGDTDVDDVFTDGQLYLRKRVSTVTFDDDYTDLDATDYQYAAHYSYDVHGNVNEFVREYKPLEVYDQRFKKFDYVYDLVSGNTNAMRYQYGEPDYFEHKYGYDADNRLIYVNTTRDGLTWDQDEKQGYYLHGPLGRREIGHNKVQNMDYAYTLQGWLKGVNGAALDEQKEMGQDGKVTNLSTTPYYADYTDIHQWTGRDAFGYVIGYFGDASNTNLRDYESITASLSSGNRWLCDIPQTLGDNLYNGNIRHVVLGIMDHNESVNTVKNRATAYRYDQLNRIKEANNYLNTGSTYSSILSSTDNGFAEDFSYDANGNLVTLNRYNGSEVVYDEFTYQYYGNVNRLSHVLDPIGNDGVESTDMDGQAANNYSYDEIGQLTADVKEGIDLITWNARRKVKEVEKGSGTRILFEYDEMGQRVKKEVREGSENNWTQQWYVLDPQGNPVAVYEHKYTNPSTNQYNEYLDLKEHQIYGGDRLGTRNYENYHLWGQTFTSTSFTVEGEFNSPSGHSPLGFLLSSYELHKRKTGMKTYEIKGHTNNVQAVVTDYKVPFVTGCSGVSNVEYYLPDVVSYTDYFVFGGVMNNRNTSSNEYRYGFQRQERDNEIKGNDNSVNYEYRMHDPQYGRFLSIDPLAASYPHNSPYAFSENQLINAVELEGLEKVNISGFGVNKSYGNIESARKAFGTNNAARTVLDAAYNKFNTAGNILAPMQEDASLEIGIANDAVHAYYYRGIGNGIQDLIYSPLSEGASFMQDGPVDYLFGKGTGTAADVWARKPENGIKLMFTVWTIPFTYFNVTRLFTVAPRNAGESFLRYAFRTSFVASRQQALTNFGFEFGTQLSVNGWNGIDWWDVGSSTGFSPIFAHGSGALADISFEKQRWLFNGKNLGMVLTDFNVKLTFGKYGTGRWGEWLPSPYNSMYKFGNSSLGKIVGKFAKYMFE